MKCTLNDTFKGEINSDYSILEIYNEDQSCPLVNSELINGLSTNGEVFTTVHNRFNRQLRKTNLLAKDKTTSKVLFLKPMYIIFDKYSKSELNTKSIKFKLDNFDFAEIGVTELNVGKLKIIINKDKKEFVMKEKNKISIEKILNKMFMFVEFINVITNQNNTVKDIAILKVNNYKKLIFNNSINFNNSKKIATLEFYQLPSDLDKIINNLFLYDKKSKRFKYQAFIHRLLDINQSRFIEMQFLNTIINIEYYLKQFKPKIIYKTDESGELIRDEGGYSIKHDYKINDLILLFIKNVEDYAEVNFVNIEDSNIIKWSDSVRKLRNILAHGQDKKYPLDNIEIYYSIEFLLLLLKLSLLIELGISKEELAIILTNNQHIGYFKYFICDK